ncbi:AraC family transcriptional regulator [Streptomyces sp. NPDC006617]|uniref:AraC family transcriptional regulator n=1 Tax=Streptomyces sp. NPDC006617 TaxID=3155354 RepID=UPI0033A31496
MTGDQLSEVFDLVEVRGVVSGGFAVRGPWVSRAEIEGLKFLAVVSGRALLTADGVEASIALGPGDVAVLNDRSWLRMEGGTGEGPPREILPEADFTSARVIGADRDADVVVGGHVDLNAAGRALLLRALPPVAHIRGSAAEAAPLRGSLHRLFVEATGDRMGSAFAIRQHGQLLLLEVLRAYVEQAELPPGWLRLLTEERLRPALDLIHADPGRSWGLRELAGAVAMSRTSFAETFRGVAGVPPLTYLSRWRMLLAQRALREGDASVAVLAAELGYASASAFSNAFKREVGESPLRYRYRYRVRGATGGP